MVTKSRAHKIHTKKRMAERFEIELNDLEYRQLINHIKKPWKYPNQQIFIKKQSNRVSLWYIKFKEKWMKVVYDKKRSNIVTVMKCRS